jgi:hypothetical protein
LLTFLARPHQLEDPVKRINPIRNVGPNVTKPAEHWPLAIASIGICGQRADDRQNLVGYVRNLVFFIFPIY